MKKRTVIGACGERSQASGAVDWVLKQYAKPGDPAALVIVGLTTPEAVPDVLGELLIRKLCPLEEIFAFVAKCLGVVRTCEEKDETCVGLVFVGPRATSTQDNPK